MTFLRGGWGVGGVEMKKTTDNFRPWSDLLKCFSTGYNFFFFKTLAQQKSVLISSPR